MTNTTHTVESNTSLEKLRRKERINSRVVALGGIKYVFAGFLLWGLAATGYLVNPANYMDSWLWLLVLGPLFVVAFGHLLFYWRSPGTKNPGIKARHILAVILRVLVATVILVIMFLLVINSYMSDVVWVLIMGNHTDGHGGHGMWSVVAFGLWTFFLLFSYYGLLANVANAKRPHRRRQRNEIVALLWTVLYSVVVPILFMLPIGLNVVHNAGA